MVRRFFDTLNTHIKGVHQAALLLGLASLAAKILALFRDRLLAGTFGAGEMLDVYFASFRLPDFLYSLFLVLATSSALLPLFFSYKEKGESAVREFVNKTTSLFIIMASVLAVVAFFSLPFLAPLLAPGFSSETLSLYVKMSRILLLSPVILGLSALVSSVVQAHHMFFVYALSPVLYNIGIIFGILFLYPVFGLSGIAWGVIVGATAHLLIQIPSIVKIGYFPKFSFGIKIKEIKNILKYSLPRSLGLGINQIVLMFLTALASYISAGSITVFQFSYNLYNIPLSMIGVSYSIAAFPALARSFAKKNTDDFLRNISTALRHIFFWSVPAVVVFVILRAHIVRVILGVGEFGWTETRLTAAALAVFSVSVVAQGIIMLFVRVFYAGGRTIFPLVSGALSGVFTIVLSYVLFMSISSMPSVEAFFYDILKVGGIEGVGIIAIILAFSLGNLINALILWRGFVVKFKNPDGGTSRSFAEHMTAGVVLGAVSYGTLKITDAFFDLNTFMGVFGHGFLAGCLGIASFVFVLYLMKNRELYEIWSAISEKFWKQKNVPIPDPNAAGQG